MAKHLYILNIHTNTMFRSSLYAKYPLFMQVLALSSIAVARYCSFFCLGL